MVQHAARRAHHDGRLLQGADLGVDALAAVNGHHPQALLIFGKLPQLLADLHGQLPGGAEHQHLRILLLAGVLHQLDGGDAEGGGLARARAGLADHIPPLEQHGDDLLLDGGKLFIARLLNGADHLRRKVQGFQSLIIHGSSLFHDFIQFQNTIIRRSLQCPEGVFSREIPGETVVLLREAWYNEKKP